jgi:ATP-dependent DNA helicase DinG
MNLTWAVYCRRPMSSSDPSAALALLGRVVKELPGGGEPRLGQQEMTAAVDAAVTSGRHLIVQAGTGTGKSLGYLVPLVASGKKVVVSTATKALQDQLAGKDLPFLADVLGVDAAGGLSFALLKGRSNYFCRQRAAELRTAQTAAIAAGRQLTMDTGAEGGQATSGPAALSETVMSELTRIATWSATTLTGDRADLDFEPSVTAWGLMSVSAGECPGKVKCPVSDSCFAEAARERAAEADVVIVNTHLYGQHVRSGGFILPAHDVVVVDEAHELEDIMADSLGTDIGSSRLSFLASRVRAVISDADQTIDLAGAGSLLDLALGPWAGKRIPAGPGADAELRRVLNAVRGRVQHGIDSLRAIPDEARKSGDVEARASRAMQAATALLNDIDSALTLGAPPVRQLADGPAKDKLTKDAQGASDNSRKESDALKVAWVEAGTMTRGPVLKIAPVDVGGALSGAVWSHVTAILTSATIPIGLRARLGLPPEETDELSVASPFDYPSQAMLYCAVGMPDPRSPDFEAASHKELRALITAAGGRTLALFTSWKAMRAAADALRDLPMTVLVQGELPKPVLVEHFSTDETSCLFATMGFWQGIDVPGRALSLVTIDKLPFSRPDEPLLMARRDRAGDRAFDLIDLPRAAMMLAQGVGRLIRTSSDKGVVAVLDRRLNSAGYRWKLISALPPMKRTRHLHEVEAFLAHLVA